MYSPSEPRFAPALPASETPLQPVVIAGAGLIGLSIALELYRRGIGVTVLDTGKPLQQASIAAAGMLAAEDPHNPPQILELSRYSRSLYPEYLARIEALSGLDVPLQTAICNQYYPTGEVMRLEEPSLDPRQLAAALLAAAHAVKIDIREVGSGLQFGTPEGGTFVVASGPWSGAPVAPRKGQMLRVALPSSLCNLNEVHRAERIYIVPRTKGPQAGSALIGATVEDAGYDKTVHEADLKRLRALAAELLPAFGSEAEAPAVESWAGLRPATPDSLPLLGEADGRIFATGHHRNGILLAPATAAVVADLIEGRQPAVDISAFAPQRFQ